MPLMWFAENLMNLGQKGIPHISNPWPPRYPELYNRLDEEFALCEQFEQWDEDTVELEES